MRTLNKTFISMIASLSEAKSKSTRLLSTMPSDLNVSQEAVQVWTLLMSITQIAKTSNA